MLRIVYNDYFSDACNLFRKAKALSMYQRVEYNTAVFVFKCLQGNVPEYLINMFSIRSISGYHLRTNDNCCLNVPKPRTTQFKQSFSYAGAVTWNALPIEVKNVSNVSQFKHACKE